MSDAPLYKFVLAPATDTDPPTNAIWTVDRVPGITPPSIPENMMATPYDYGAVGDGVADDTDAIQAWFDAIAGTAGYGKTGTFAISSTVRLSGCTIYGAGNNNFVLTITPDFPSSSPLIRNKNQSTDTQIDNGIVIYSCGFQGSSSLAIPDGTAMIDVVGVNSFTLFDCKLGHYRRHLLAFTNSTDIDISHSELYDWGSLSAVPEPNTCQYDGGYAVYVGGTCSNYRISYNHMHDGQWTAILVGGSYADISHNIIQRVNEAGIFGGLVFSRVCNNHINSVRRKDCAAHGIEVGTSRSTISDNIIFDCDYACIYVSNCVETIVSDNVLSAPNQARTPTINYGTTGALTIRNAQDPLDPPGSDYVNKLTITGNQISDATGRSTYGILFIGTGPAPPLMNSVTCHGNNLAGTTWLSKAICYDDPIFVAPVIGTDFMIRDNLGAAPSDLSVSSVNFIVPEGQTGSFDVGAVGFYSSWIKFQALLPSATKLGLSVGQQSWQTGWDITTQTKTSGPTYFGASGMSWSTDGSDSYAADTSGRSSITVREPSGRPICVASVTAVNSDGFTLTLSTSPFMEVNAGGTGYALLDTGTVSGGDGLAEYTVTAVSGGAVTEILFSGGSGYGNSTGSATTATSGAGTGLTIDTFVSDPTTEQVIVNAICHA